MSKKYPLHRITYQAVAQTKYTGRGKPKAGEQLTVVGYKMESTFEKNQEEIAQELNKKGRFILATNDLDSQTYPDERMLEEYKEQQTVERGFRFLKDPWFMLDSIFLKDPKRIEALMMIMTLCLMVYNVAQYKLRQTLKDTNETLPNQLNKQINTPTLRWIFQLMEGISIIHMYQESIQKPAQQIITNLTKLRRKIIRLFGDTASRIYGLIQNNGTGGVGI